MLILATADHFLQMFCWVGEGVGLCSYLIIIFWFIRIQANKAAAIKAKIVHRIGAFRISVKDFYDYIWFWVFRLRHSFFWSITQLVIFSILDFHYVRANSKIVVRLTILICSVFPIIFTYR